MRRFFFIPVLLGIQLLLNGQTLRRPLAAPYTSLGAYSTQHVDVFSFTANQAALAQLNNSAAAIYAERRFLLSELDHYAAVAGFTTSSGNFGLATDYSGSADYNETKLGLAYGRKLGTKLDIGAQFNYNAIRLGGGYGNASAVSVELGTVLHISERLNTGFHATNPMGGKFGKDLQEKLASVYSFAVGYDASRKFFISAEIEKEEDRPVSVNAGFQYQLIPQLLARAGIASATSSAWLGVGLIIKSFRLDITTSYHPQLGISPGLLLLFHFKSPPATTGKK